MKIVTIFSMSLLCAITSLAMEQQLSLPGQNVSVNKPLHPTLITLPRDMKVYILAHLATARGNTKKESEKHLAVAAKSIRALSEVNKEFYTLINDPTVMKNIMKRLENSRFYERDHRILDVAFAIGTPASARSFGQLEADCIRAWMSELVYEGDIKAFSFFLRACQNKIIDLPNVDWLLHHAVEQPRKVALLLTYPGIQLNTKEFIFYNKTPLTYAKYLLKETLEFRRYDNVMRERESALKQTIKLLEEHGATE